MSKDNFETSKMDPTLKNIVNTAGLAHNVIKDIPKINIPKDAILDNIIKKPIQPVMDIAQMEKFHAERDKQKSEEIERDVELTESSKETAIVISEFKNIVQEFIVASEEHTKSTNKLNRTLFWFTLISVMATVLSTIIAIVQFIEWSP